MKNVIKKKEIIIAIVFFLLGLGIMYIYSRNELASVKTARKIVSEVVVVSSQLYNISEMKYVFFAQEASKKDGFPKKSLDKLDEMKRQQDQLLLELNGLLGKLGIEQNLEQLPLVNKENTND